MGRFFSWIKGLFYSRQETPKTVGYDTFSVEERAIYHYFDGQKTRSADPIILYKNIMNVWADLQISLQVAESPMKDNTKAHDESIKLIRGIFDLKGLEEGGLTEGETKALLWHFFAYTEQLKKNSQQTPTPPAETSPSSNSYSGETRPIWNGPDSGSTVPGPPAETPGL